MLKEEVLLIVLKSTDLFQMLNILFYISSWNMQVITPM